jgi:putative DNA primase/helicase
MSEVALQFIDEPNGRAVGMDRRLALHVGGQERDVVKVNLENQVARSRQAKSWSKTFKLDLPIIEEKLRTASLAAADELQKRNEEDAKNKETGDAKPRRKQDEPTPMALAKAFLAESFTGPTGIQLRSQNERFFRWDGHTYCRIPTHELEKSVLNWIDGEIRSAKPRNARDVVAFLHILGHIPFDIDLPVMETGSGFVEGGALVSMKNGIIDLDEAVAAPNGKPILIREHTSKWISEFGLDYDYNPKATCEKWFTTLTEIFSGDAECINLLAEWFGYCLTDDTTLHAILFLEGLPRTGKSTLLRILQYIIGERNTATPMLMNIASSFGLSGLLGKRLAICADAHLGHGAKALAVLELVKGITGEDPVEINLKYEKPVTVRLKTRFALAVNELPKFGDGANALATRAIILPLRNSFLGRENRNLEAELRPEAPGIFLWAIDGLRRLRANGRFTIPKVSAEILQDFKRLTSPIHAFLEDCCDIGNSTYTVSRSELWSAWKAYCDDNKNQPGSRDRFGNSLRSQIQGLTSTQPRADGMRVRQYGGVKLK